MHPAAPPALRPEAFEIDNLDDELRVDRLCVELLQQFAAALVSTDGQTPLEAGTLARGADYFLREFVIAERRANLFRLSPAQIRPFAGHWYIIRNLEPNLAELEAILTGVAAFYTWLARQDLYPAEQAKAVAERCAELDDYQRRIDAFWAIEGDGFARWLADCPLDPPDPAE